MKKLIIGAGGLFALILIGIGIVAVGSAAPSEFPQGVTLSVKEGTSITDTAQKLFDNGMIKSTILFKAYVNILGKAGGVQTGNYFFGESESVLRIAYRLAKGLKGVPQIKVTIPEGLASPDVARAIKKDIPTFDDKAFLKLARPLEGYLFPDTYFFDKNTTPEDAIAAMRTNFDNRTKNISVPKELAGNSGITFKSVLTMASLVEEEATSSKDRRIIAGILWKRMANGMALQVDAPFFYILGKTSAQLTVRDLATSSPYNLYKHLGLPPGPIDNPGLDAIVDTINPTITPYWFFLSGTDGRTHFAADLDGHVANMKYLK
ncbi:MAG: aminodeoxychorismate lyase, protein [Candidatus Parcubacteria bacterium]|nr:aminodeoxychorismate lyase, protein [Candidatus Parcubacteria bacterium]